MEKDTYKNLEIELNNFLNSPKLIRKILYGYGPRIKFMGESPTAFSKTIYTYLSAYRIPYNINLIEVYFRKNTEFIHQKIGTEIKKLKLEYMLRN